MKRLFFAVLVSVLFVVGTASSAFADGWPSCCLPPPSHSIQPR